MKSSAAVVRGIACACFDDGAVLMPAGSEDAVVGFDALAVGEDDGDAWEEEAPLAARDGFLGFFFRRRAVWEKGRRSIG